MADSNATEFTVKQSWTLAAAPEAVYQRFLSVGDWWNSAHSWSGDAHNLSIEPKINGCFCEKLPKSGGAVRHLEVVYLDPGKVIRLAGGLGPLQALAVNGTMTVQFAAAEGGGTKLSLTYAVGGYLDKGLNTIAPMVDAMLKEQFGRLQSYIEAAKK